MTDQPFDQSNTSVASHTTGNVLAVIVSYNPDIGALLRTVNELLDQGCKVLVVDNASQDQRALKQSIDELGLDKLSHDVHFIANESNFGLGAAHNQGLLHAKQQACEYLLIMDQDSLPMQGMVPSLTEAHKTLSQTQKVSAVGACYLNALNQSESFFVRFGALKFQREYATRELIEADFLISSGSLFHIDALDEIGGMDEALFIDHVDTEWFLRARSKGYKAYGVSAARMSHGLGEDTHRVNLGGRQRNVPQHKPFRYYYIFRNSIVLYTRGYTSWLWKWNDAQRLLMIFVMFGLVKAPRWQNMKMMLLGIGHGVLGKTGQYDFAKQFDEQSESAREKH